MPSKPKHMTRVERDKSVLARIMRQGKTYQKRFSLAKHKTWTGAERAAGKWLKELEKTLPPCLMNAPGRSERNQSGVVGVSLSYSHVTRPSGKEYYYYFWVANWKGCNKAGGVPWYITQDQSDEDAFTLAVISREQELADREKALKYFAKIKGTKAHKEILARKLITLE